MGGVLLAINLADLMVATQTDQGRQGNFGRIRLAVEHRLAKHRLSDRNAIQAARQFTSDPGFDAVGKTRTVQVNISLNHVRHDPGAVCPRAGGVRAGLDDLGERAVHADFAVRIAGKFDQCLFERGMQSETIDLQHHARFGTPPQNGLIGAVPGKDAIPVCVAERPDRQIGTGTQQTRGWCVEAPSGMDRRKRLATGQPGQGGWRVRHLEEMQAVCMGSGPKVGGSAITIERSGRSAAW